MKKICALLLVLCLLPCVASATEVEAYNERLAAFEQRFRDAVAGTENETWSAAYEEPVTITTASSYGATMDVAVSKWGELYGETWNDNRFTKIYKDVFNIDLQYNWWASDSDYEQKLRLEMASNNLPDLTLVTNQSDLAQLAESGMILDLTDMIDEYASTWDKETWQTDGGILMGMATYDDAVYGLPIVQASTDEFSYLWLRKDWMDALGLANPTTFDDLVTIMDAFMAADFDGNGVDDTIGIGIDKDLWYSTRGLFSAFQAYPQYWIEKDGALEWGGISEENKAALQFLADLYAKGYIDPEFVTEDNTTMLESVISGNCGVVYGGHWLGHTFGDCKELDENADWTCVKLPSVNGEDVYSPVKSYYRGWVVISSKCEHPEAVFKILGITTYAQQCDPDCQWLCSEENISYWYSPCKTNLSATFNADAYEKLLYAFETGDTSNFDGVAQTYWDQLHGEYPYEWDLMFGPEEDAAMQLLKESIENDRIFFDAFTGAQSDYMLERWETILSEELIAYTKIIIGKTTVEEGFADWVNTFNSLGGDRITQEVNEWYAEQQ